MIILAIESSCDETACAIVKDYKYVLSNAIASQIKIHQVTHGVVPEVAARAHVENLQPVLEKAFLDSGLTWEDIDAIAVTAGPGLLTSVMTGMTFAASLAWIYNKPLIGVNHVHGHLISASLDLPASEKVEFPIAILSVSGGHNDIYVANSYEDFTLLGSTQDDAAGEAYDKAAKALGLEYPGGPIISKIAKEGDPLKYELPMPILKQGFDFSFSGLKSAFFRLIDQCGGKETLDQNPQLLADLAASFQHTINSVLSYKLSLAAEEYNCKEVHLVGGVSANLDLRSKIKKSNKQRKFRHPLDFSYCTDNAAMIAGAAFYIPKEKWYSPGEMPELITW